MVQVLGRTKLYGAQEKSREGVLFACLGVFICLFAFHISTINFSHFNQTLHKPAPTGTSRHALAQRTPAFFLSPLLPFQVISRKIFCLLTLQLFLGHSTRRHGERATSASLIRMQSFKAVLNLAMLENLNYINGSTSLVSNSLILPRQLSREQVSETL